MIRNAESLNQVNELLQKEDAVMLYFLNDACAPCMALRPKIESLLKDYPEMLLVYVDSRNQPDISGAFNVFSNPTLILYFTGRESMRFSKYVSVDQVEKAIERPYSLIFE